MTLNDFIKQLQTLASLGYGELPMYATHGASGATDRMGSPYVRQTNGSEDSGDLIDFPVGTKYVDVYIGN